VQINMLIEQWLKCFSKQRNKRAAQLVSVRSELWSSSFDVDVVSKMSSCDWSFDDTVCWSSS